MDFVEDLDKLIGIKSKRLQGLREQEAFFGRTVDPSVPMEIEELEAQIAELEKECDVQ